MKRDDSHELLPSRVFGDFVGLLDREFSLALACSSCYRGTPPGSQTPLEVGTRVVPRDYEEENPPNLQSERVNRRRVSD